MANKHLLFTLLPLALCDLSTKLFREEIVNTGAEPFFDSFFKTLRASDGNIKCAFFDLENTIINGSIAKAIFAYQLREIEFAFKKEDVRPIFGFEDAFTSSIDTPYHSCVPDSFIFSNTVVNLDSIVNDIEYLYDDRRKPTDKKKIQALIAVWYRLVNARFPAIERCEFLGTSVCYRLLHGMDKIERQTLMKKALAASVGGAIDVYEHIHVNGPQQTTLKVHLKVELSPYPEALYLMRALKNINVHPFLISRLHSDYVHSATEAFELGIPLSDCDGSYYSIKDELPQEKRFFFNEGQGKVATIKKLMKTRRCVPVLGLGGSSGSVEMLQYILKYEGYAMMMYINHVDPRLLKLKETNSRRLHLQKLTRSRWERNEHNAKRVVYRKDEKFKNGDQMRQGEDLLT